MGLNTEKLTVLARELRRKWGKHALDQGVALLQPPEPLSTRHPTLDHLLEGGITRSSFIELLGRPTSGATSLALGLIAAAQQEGGDGVWVDMLGTFDPFQADGCGIDLKQMLLVRPPSGTHALGITEDVVQGNGSLVVLSHTSAILQGFQGHRVLGRGVHRIATALRHSTSIVVVLTPHDHTPTPAYALSEQATLRLVMQGRKWLADGAGLRGFQALVRVVKHKTLLGQEAPITIPLV